MTLLSAIPRWVLGLLFFIVLLFGLALVAAFQTKSGETRATVILGGREFQLDLADTPATQARGLSGRTSLPPRGGMLFRFPTARQYSFWMKDMRFAIDIFWIHDGTIVFIHENISPSAPGTSDVALPRYQPPQPVDTVIETRAGVADLLGIKTGQQVRILLR